jgi:hypothetical protein
MILGLVVTGRASSRRSEPLVGPLLNHKPLPVVFIRLQIFQRFGALPAFSEAAWRTGD